MDSLHSSAVTLAEGSNDLLCAYEPDLKRFKYQSLSIQPSHYRIDGKPIEDISVSDAVATAVDPRYAGLPATLEKYDAETGALTQMGHVLRSGQNVALGMEHADLFDIALGEVGISNHFRKQKIAHRPVLIVSKAMDFLGVNIEALKMPPDIVTTFLKGLDIEVEPDNTVPVRRFLGVAAAAVYMTVPSTKTFSQIRGLQHEAIGWFNKHVTSSLAKDLDRGNEGNHQPVLLGVAAPGTTVKKLDVDALDDELKERHQINTGEEVDVVGGINPGIVRFMKQALTYAAAIRLENDPPAVAIDKEFLCVKARKDVSELADKLVALASGLEPDKRFIYDETGALPVIRK